MTWVHDMRLRSNPRLELVPFDRLDAAERQALGAMNDDGDFYGLLVPPAESGRPIKSVSRDAALLFLTLREPARMPHLIATLFGDSADGPLRQLVLDGVFEVEHDGHFVSGAPAMPIVGGAICARAPDSRIARLSTDAIAYAAALEGLSVAQLAARIYMFNRAPCTPSLQRRHAGDDQLVAHLVGGDAATAHALAARILDRSQDGWLRWRARTAAPRLDFKLYVSPALDHLPEVFRLCVETFARVACPQFKIGRTAFGLVRPDKLVAYFSSLEHVQRAAELIHASAASIAAQGVPFTAAIDADGLVSWGMDPPRFAQVLAWQVHQSWRQWVAERVAVYILAARDGGADSVVDFVLSRVALDGIDPATWSPSLAIWDGAGMARETA